MENFKGKASCFVEQYGEFVVGNPNGRDLHVNGRLTLGENIADVGGVNAAFKAWKRKETSEGGRDGEGEKHDGEGKKRDELLPGLQAWTREQLFFISYANWWCGKARPEYEVEGVFRDPHAPTWARILVSSLSFQFVLGRVKRGKGETVIVGEGVKREEIFADETWRTGNNGEFQRLQGSIQLSGQGTEV